jgi:AraC family transcriptional regulator
LAELIYPTVTAGAETELRRKGPAAPILPSGLGSSDPLVSQLMLSLSAAFLESAPDLYAQTAGEMLAAHLLVRHGRYGEPHYRNASDGRLRKVEEFMRENLASAVSLEDLAREAGVSRFHLLRLYKKLRRACSSLDYLGPCHR